MDAQERPLGTLVPELPAFFWRSKRKYLVQLGETRTLKANRPEKELQFRTTTEPKGLAPQKP